MDLVNYIRYVTIKENHNHIELNGNKFVYVASEQMAPCSDIWHKML